MKFDECYINVTQCVTLNISELLHNVLRMLRVALLPRDFVGSLTLNL